MTKPLRVLILEDRPSDARLIVNELRQANLEPVWDRVENEQDFLARLNSTWDLILADYNMGQFDAPRALQCLRESGKDIPLIIVSGSIGEEIAVAAMKEGAADYLLKDRLGRLGPAISQALEQRQMRDAQRKAEETLRERTQLILLSAEVGLALNRTGTLHDMLQQCAESLVSNLDAALARIWTFQVDENVLELQASAGLDRSLDGPYRRVPLGTFKIGRIARDRMPHFTNDAVNDPHIADRDWVRREGLVSFAGHPLIVEDRLVGALAVFGRQPLPQGALDALAAVSNQIAAGIDRKRAEERLQFTQFTIDHIATAVFWSDAEGRFFNVNDAACDLTGYTREELLSLRFFDLDLNVTAQSWTRTWQELQQRRALTTESRLRHKNGTKIPVSVNTNLLSQEGAECSCTFVQDIIERKAAEFAQQQSELRFRAIFDQTFEFVGLLSSDGMVLEVNQPALDFRGLKPGDVAGLPLWETAWLDMSAEVRAHVQEAVMRASAGDFVRSELVVRSQEEGLRIFDFSIKPVKNDAGQVELLIVEARDISDQKRLEEQFRQAQKMEAIGKLAGGVAHDFNNLLTIILGYSEILQESVRPGDPLLEFIAEIHSAGERAAGLTRQLLAFSRKQVLLPVVLDLNGLVADMEKMLSRLIGEDIQLVFRPARDLWRVRVDSGQMEQVIMNLVVNARDAMPKGGKLTIKTANITLDKATGEVHPDARPGDYVLITVSDTGCGMDNATLSQIFEPFFTTKGPEKGTGLGLSTSYGIVKQSGGHITVDSEIGIGTTFNIYLPRDKADVVASQAHLSRNPRRQGTETVLLVEDEDAVRALASTILRHHGFNVIEASHGGEALTICKQYQGTIHLLATDVVMPNLGGRELAERVLAIRPKTKVLFLSGYIDDTIVRHGLVDSGTAFLQKPFTPEALSRAVGDALDK